ncbi:interleukin-15 isoform X3 [Festucalex cinctus]
MCAVRTRLSRSAAVLERPDALHSGEQKNSSAMLYAPSMNDIQAKCDNLSLKCFLVELVMVIGEEDVDIDNDDVLCILNFNDNLHLEGNAISCPPCEAHSLGNVTTFLNRLKTLLQAMAQ